MIPLSAPGRTVPRVPVWAVTIATVGVVRVRHDSACVVPSAVLSLASGAAGSPFTSYGLVVAVVVMMSSIASLENVVVGEIAVDVAAASHGS